MPRVTMSMEAVSARQALVFARHLLGESAVDHTEYLCDNDAPVSVGKEMRRNLRMASLPILAGTEHVVRFEGARIAVGVVDLAAKASERTGRPDPERMCRCCKGSATSADELALVLDADTYAIVNAFLDAARAHCEAAVTTARTGTDKIRKYLFDNGYWERLGDSRVRPPETVFLTADARELVEHVVSFMTDPGIKERYQTHGTPYKLNVLLHGPPGTGKTSLIDSVAGRLGSDVFIVQFTARLRDTDLAVAMRRVAEHPNPVIVMEDVDCIFSDRKAHDSSKNAVTLSGFLNSLDGMCRPEGSVVFLTTNDASALDPAVTRSRRIDRTVMMSHADAEQTENMLRYFFPKMCPEALDRFCRGCAQMSLYTTAELHEYLFDCERGDEPTHKGFADAIRRKRMETAHNRADRQELSGMYM